MFDFHTIELYEFHKIMFQLKSLSNIMAQLLECRKLVGIDGNFAVFST